jgi:hypothetical protein
MKKMLLWLITLPLSFFVISLFYQSYSLLYWVNFLFLVGLLLVIIGCLMFVTAGDFFASFIHSCRVFFSRISKTEQVIEEIERKKNPINASFRRKNLSYQLILFFGIGYCVISLLLSLLIS